MTSVYRHSVRALAPDYLRSAAGLLLTAGPVAAIPVAPALVWPLAAAAALFGLHGLRTGLRQLSAIECGPDRIARGRPLPAEIRWGDLRDMRLRYYSTRRDGGNGWMLLVLKGPRSTIRIDSTLTGFKEIVLQAKMAADKVRLDLAPATRSNLELLGREFACSGLFTDPDAGSFKRQES